MLPTGQLLRIDGHVKGALSIRFASTLDDNERVRLVSELSSHGARLTTWLVHADSGRTYARVDHDGSSPAGALRSLYPEARVHEPPLTVLEVRPDEAGMRDRLCVAAGGLAGVAEATAFNDGLVVEIDDERTPLALLVHVIDVELAMGRGGRRIRPLLGLSDRALARFAAAVLATPDLDESRLIETYAEPLMRAGPGVP
jgi:hypothetical protein